MSYSTILAAIKTLLDAVTGIGKTYDYFRYTIDRTDQETLFTTAGGKFHTWFITRSAVPAQRLANKQELREHHFDLWGFYAVDDTNASEKTFQALCETICNKFNDCDNIQLVSGTDMIKACEILEITHVEWCSTFCHRAQIRIYAEEERSAA